MTSGESFDLIVAGGGPAGLAAAAAVARRGRSVLVVEREAAIGSPVHTSGATAPTTMARHGIPQDLYHPLRRLRFCGPNSEAVFDYDDPVLVVIDVRNTYQHLGYEVERAGGIIRTATAAR